VEISADDARRIIAGLRRHGQMELHQMADHIEGEIGDPYGIVYLKPKIKTAARIAHLCATEGIGAGNRFSVAASYGRYREAEAQAMTE
jgi:hypothetical protein